jgi:hypothetical protein
MQQRVGKSFHNWRRLSIFFLIDGGEEFLNLFNVWHNHQLQFSIILDADATMRDRHRLCELNDADKAL